MLHSWSRISLFSRLRMIVSYRQRSSAFAVERLSLYNHNMTFILDAQSDKPVVLLNMDDTTPLQDYSPNNATATTTGGTPVQHASLVKGAAWAPIFTNTITASYNSPVFLKTFESRPFSLECWAKPIQATPVSAGDQKVMSHSDQYDGIVINGTVIKFITKYTTAPISTCSYDMQIPQACHIVGVHTESKNSLFVNGLLVDEQILTDVQQADTYASSSTSTLVSGTTAATQSVAINGVALYTVALGQEVIARHFATGRATPSPDNIVPAYAGDFIPMSLGNATLFLDQWIQTADDWNMGNYDNTAVYKDRLVPTSDQTGLSVLGAWYKAISLESSNFATVYGVQLNWDGNGATVQVSIDGTTWETVKRGINCTTVPSGTTTSGKVLQIRITFPGGTVNDESFVDNLNVVGLTSALSNVTSGRTVTFTTAHPERDYPFTAYSDNYGVEIDSGGTAVISADALGASVARTLEVLIKRQGSTNPTISMTGTTYINGASGSATLLDGQWELMHVVAASDVTGTITINGPCQVGYVGIYDTALSAATVAAIYSDYVGTDAPRIPDASVISVAESVNAANIYQHDWTITASG